MCPKNGSSRQLQQLFLRSCWRGCFGALALLPLMLACLAPSGGKVASPLAAFAVFGWWLHRWPDFEFAIKHCVAPWTYPVVSVEEMCRPCRGIVGVDGRYLLLFSLGLVPLVMLLIGRSLLFSGCTGGKVTLDGLAQPPLHMRLRNVGEPLVETPHGEVPA